MDLTPQLYLLRRECVYFLTTQTICWYVLKPNARADVLISPICWQNVICLCRELVSQLLSVH